MVSNFVVELHIEICGLDHMLIDQIGFACGLWFRVHDLSHGVLLRSCHNLSLEVGYPPLG